MKNEGPSMITRRVPIDSLKGDDQNARSHGKQNLETIKRSLQRFGQVEPLVIRKETRTVIAGNGRLEIMRGLGWTEVEVVEVDISKKEAAALAIVMNRSAELGRWNIDAITPLLCELHADGIDFESLGFSAIDLEKSFQLQIENDLIRHVKFDVKPNNSREIGEDEFSTFDNQCPRCGFGFDNDSSTKNRSLASK